MQSQKWQNDLGSFPRQTIQHHSNPGLCSNHWCQRSWSRSVLWRPTRPSRSNTKKKDVLFIIGDWNAKIRSQEVPGVTGNNKTRDDSTHGCHQMVKSKIRLIIFFAAEDGEALLLLLSHFSRVRLCATPWTAAYQAPPSMEFSRQEYWSGVPSPSRGEALYSSKNNTWSWLWLRPSVPFCKIQAQIEESRENH